MLGKQDAAGHDEPHAFFHVERQIPNLIGRNDEKETRRRIRGGGQKDASHLAAGGFVLVSIGNESDGGQRFRRIGDEYDAPKSAFTFGSEGFDDLFAGGVDGPGDGDLFEKAIEESDEAFSDGGAGEKADHIEEKEERHEPGTGDDPVCTGNLLRHHSPDGRDKVFGWNVGDQFVEFGRTKFGDQLSECMVVFGFQKGSGTLEHVAVGERKHGAGVGLSDGVAEEWNDHLCERLEQSVEQLENELQHPDRESHGNEDDDPGTDAAADEGIEWSPQSRAGAFAVFFGIGHPVVSFGSGFGPVPANYHTPEKPKRKRMCDRGRGFRSRRATIECGFVKTSQHDADPSGPNETIPMAEDRPTFEADMASIDFSSLNDRVCQLLGEGDRDGLRALLREHHPSELATLLEQIPLEELVIETFRAIPEALSGEVLASLPEALREDLLEELSETEIAHAVRDIAPDDAADIVEDMPYEQREDVLREVPADQRADIETLIEYSPDSAGGLMSTRFTALRSNLTAAQAIAEIRELADSESETIYYVYVVDDDGVLLGVLSLRQLMILPSSRRISDAMVSPMRTVEAHEDQEKVASVISEYDLLAVPVVDDRFRVIGVVTVDDILDVREEEETEDVQKLLGAGGDERVDSPLMLSFRRRLPWLFVNLGTAFLAAMVVATLEDAIRLMAAVAIFMPVVAGISGNTGSQSLAVVFRSVILGEGGSHLVRRIMYRSLMLGLMNGIVIGAFSGLIAFTVLLGSHEMASSMRLQLAQVIGISMMLAMTLGSMVGAGIPLLMRRLGWDPAQNAHILLTSITDMTALAIYLGLVIAWVSKAT